MARPYGSIAGAAISCRRTRSSRSSQALSVRARLPYGASLRVMGSPTVSLSITPRRGELSPG